MSSSQTSIHPHISQLGHEFPGPNRRTRISFQLVRRRFRSRAGETQCVRNAGTRCESDSTGRSSWNSAKPMSPAARGWWRFESWNDALGLTQQAGEALADTRIAQNTRHGLIAQLRQSVYSRLASYEDTNGAEQLCDDPAMRYVVGERARSSTAASTSQMGRFETDILTQGVKLQALREQPGRWIDQVSGRVIARFFCGLHTIDRDDHVLFIGRILAQCHQRLILG